MKRTRLRALVLTAAAAAALASVAVVPAGVPGSGIAPAHAQQVDLSAEWDKAWDRAGTESAKAYESLFKWCMDKKLNFTAINVRRWVLRYDPHNEEVRKYVGYAKSPEGTWIRNDARRDAIREEADIEDPKAQKYPEKEGSTHKKVAGYWKGVAMKAKKNGEAEPANAAAWQEKAARAWERVLQVDSSNEEAHKALNHPKFANKYVRPEALKFLKVRDERKQGGLKRANLKPKTEPAEFSPLLAKAGFAGAAAKGQHIVVSTVYGKDVSTKICEWGEKTILDFVEIYGAPQDVGERMPYNQYEIVKDTEELRKLFVAVGWKAPEIERFLKFFSGTGGLQAGSYTAARDAGVGSDDLVIHKVGEALAHALRNVAIQDLGSPNEGLEDWLQESVAYDMSRRMTGTALTICGAFGKYGNNIEPNPDKDIWIELAKRQVEVDDDVELGRLWKCKHENQDIGGPETVKGYAFLQFLFESDTEKAREWVRAALAQGTPKAVDTVYGVSLEELDRQYRDWIVKSW
jgi:hypothetical protein